ncbi:MAG: hypothetical protein JKY37_28870 [Nannocystaceae bacterium]|nr:hypothetical protein [Nannocystaceae bacterium]
MRWGLGLLLIVGCNGIFEVNPSFVGETDGSESSAGATGDVSASDGATSAASGSSETASTPLVCDVDTYEPNNEQFDAELLEGLATGDEAPRQIVSQIETALDVDWFKINIEQTGSVEPRLTATSDQAVTLCVVFGCSEGTPKVECGDAIATEGNGDTVGCCAERMVSFAPSCGTGGTGGTGGPRFDANGYAAIRIRATDEIDECLAYSVEVSI